MGRSKTDGKVRIKTPAEQLEDQINNRIEKHGALLYFRPYSAYMMRAGLGHSVVIVKHSVNGAKTEVDLSPVIDASWSAAASIERFLEDFFKKQPAQLIGSGDMLRRAIRERRGYLAQLERQISEQKKFIAEDEAQLRLVNKPRRRRG